MRTLIRVCTITWMAVLSLLLLTVLNTQASPINPDIHKVLSRPAYSPSQFEPARAGWNGPETTNLKPVNLTLETIGPTATQREVRAGLLAAFVPDYRALAAIGLIILLLRRIRTARRLAVVNAGVTASTPSPILVPDAQDNSTPSSRAA